MKSKKILVLIFIALIVALFASILIIKLKQTNKIDMVSEKEIVNEINNTEEEITEENIVVESKIEEQKTQEEADIPEKEKESQQELQKQITIATQDKKVESPKQAEQSKVTQVITKQKTEINEQLKQDIKTETQIQEQTKFETKVEEKQSETPKCTDTNHGVGVGNSNKWFNSKQEAINYYQGIIKTWGDKWEKFEIDDETYQKNCPYGYETWSCPFCEKWTINFYYN